MNDFLIHLLKMRNNIRDIQSLEVLKVCKRTENDYLWRFLSKIATLDFVLSHPSDRWKWEYISRNVTLEDVRNNSDCGLTENHICL